MPGVWETEAEWRRLKRELDAWLAHRSAVDVHGQHRSQLQAVRTLVSTALDTLHVAMAPSPAADPLAWRAHDRRLAWVRRVWTFFRERFDQRDDADLAPVLQAADEVVWCCHREPFVTRAGPRGLTSDHPPPLPYLEAGTSPEVFPRGLVPAGLRQDVDAPFLRTVLERLPFAVVRVPAGCVTAPWWLVYLGHEVGHEVDDRLLGYQSRAAIVATLGLGDAACADWTAWSGELFADLYGLLMFGPWALWALAAAEERDDAAMRARRDTYPPPAVRLLVLARACGRLDIGRVPTHPALASARRLADADPAMAQQVADGARVAAALVAHAIDGDTLVDLAAHDPDRWSAGGPVEAWTARLETSPPRLVPDASRARGREVLAASVMSRAGAGRVAFDGTRLATHLLEWLPAVREPGARHGATAPSLAAYESAGRALAETLLRAEGPS